MKKLILLIVPLLLLTGCDNRECIKSHTEQITCVWYQPIISGKFTITVPHYYDCEITVCDEYEVIKNAKTTN